ncbi:Na+/H+ antiporter subunit E [Brachybacterium sp. YJGR34]|uniref:Na+/H+ antiporter subunit E n=1 Tax=Brachybacterium sp. YJGR34 TaxID=2059911 RepID=UPI000E0AB4CF|nr:Na+/H+ antiporter subunit E [Brachybacterium sp. YJGR34]
MMRLWYALSYALWILREIIAGSIEVARTTYSPGTRTSPAIVEYPLRAETDVEIVAMASSITITPGTLVLGTSHGTLQQRPSLFVHALFASSREQVLADLTEMEDRLLRAVRGRGGAAAIPATRRGGMDLEYRDGRALRRSDEVGNTEGREAAEARAAEEER